MNTDAVKEFRSLYGKCKYIQGQKFGRLKAIKPNGKNKFGMMQWICECECGVIKTITISHLTTGQTKSCGCIRDKKIAQVGLSNKTHGLKKSKLYNIWRGIKKRCRLNSNKAYKDYGARGIDMCDSWFYSFENFYNDVGEIPDGGYSLDRIDNNKGYFKSNCRWASKKDQANNRRNNVFISYNGETHTVSEWSRITKLNKSTILYRLKKGLPVDKVLYTSL